MCKKAFPALTEGVRNRYDDRSKMPNLWHRRGLGEVSPFRPFCSKRCQLIDLGEWADEEKRIPSNSDLSESEDWSEMDDR